MVDYTLPSANLTSPDQLLAYTSGQIPILFPLILLFIWVVIALSGYFSQERKLGRSSFAQWGAIASLITTTGAFVLFLIPGVLNIETVSISVVVTIIFGFWFLFDSGD